ncbi:DUF1330 domain-containing protein [Nocardioides solisilvae]|uniref:DUF1330 domain-containing protein n=1 Tax=Nocardioides solisilvae TaxID=1542435 RepID=UPI00194F98DD|nr:DUF1330 domain-containing protein [Nocardioides solisilvae]
MPHVDPSAEDLAEFWASAPDEPFVMLNLLRYAADGGRERYAEYLRRAAPYVEQVGARVLYLGQGGPTLVGDEPWDSVMLVWYPSPGAFRRMLEAPGYAEVAELRSAALAAAVLEPTRPTGPSRPA